MKILSTRLQPVFQKTKSICFGRFLVDVPIASIVTWGGTDIELGIKVYRDGDSQVKLLAQEFIDQLNSKKAIYHDNAPLLLAADEVASPQGKIITGYEDFEAINGLKINGYFSFNKDGLIIEARPLRKDREKAVAEIHSIAQRLQPRMEAEVPHADGNCIEYAFLPDKAVVEKGPGAEHIRIGFRLTDFPDVSLSIYVAPSNSFNPQSDW